MWTGAEIPKLRLLARKIRLGLRTTSEIREETDTILNDRELAELLGSVYELNENHAVRNIQRCYEAHEITSSETISALKGLKYALMRYISARKANSLARAYRYEVKETANVDTSVNETNRLLEHMNEVIRMLRSAGYDIDDEIAKMFPGDVDETEVF
ncbi:hypothetical protein F5890DRAFT_1123320 [Lentinula detonsa]|uniref:Uncharacterized protein n=1 Tax=Lentinula detonsa TaxID=2804962 RepID=A0AA38UU00_9AGAR|nr:hypothetical protein F5890DRAFT_1123320 [Lentinula detonsa]